MTSDLLQDGGREGRRCDQSQGLPDDVLHHATFTLLHLIATGALRLDYQHVDGYSERHTQENTQNKGFTWWDYLVFSYN